MKITGGTALRMERVNMINNAPYVSTTATTSSDVYVSERTLNSFPVTLVDHLVGKIDEALVFLKNRFITNNQDDTISTSITSLSALDLLSQLIKVKRISSNTSLSELGNKLARCLRILPQEIVRSQLFTYQTCPTNLSDLLLFYDDYLRKNKEIFTTISQHHQNVKDTEEWSDVAANTSALKDYSVMAQAMGDKAWVLEANWWMANFIREFFFGDTAAKFARKYFTPFLCRTDADSHPLVQQYLHSLQNSIIVHPSTVSASTSAASEGEVSKKVRVLDVGSCYNPLARSPDAAFLDITAIDLHPANQPNPIYSTCTINSSNERNSNGREHASESSKYHVHTCDFLTVTVTDDVEDIVVTTNAISEQTQQQPQTQPFQMDTKEAEAEEYVTYVQSIPKFHYHAVTMSLVLCYLPDPMSRAHMIRQAYATLQANHGLLLIVEKDSIFRNINHSSVKKDPRGTWPVWRRAMYRLGFECVKYEHHRHTPTTTATTTSQISLNAHGNGATATAPTSGTNVAVAVRMFHIMVFVTRNLLPDPAPVTMEDYHPPSVVAGESGETLFTTSKKLKASNTHSVEKIAIYDHCTNVVTDNTTSRAELIEQLWIKQDLETPQKLNADTKGKGSTNSNKDRKVEVL